MNAPHEPILQAPSPLDWRALERRGDPPPRAWLSEPWVPRGAPLLLAGPGGVGKSLFVQQFASAGALGADFLGPGTMFRTLAWSCEDDENELWRRQRAIAQYHGVELSDFALRLHIVPRVGEDNVLASSEFGRLMFTNRLEELRQQAHDVGAEAVVLDNVRHLYLGDAWNNAMVTAFVNAVVGALRGMAVIFVGHTARAAGSEYADAAAWENAVRTRLYFGDRLPDSSEEPSDPAARVLARRKANYAGKDVLRFRYEGGVLVPEAAAETGGLTGHLRAQRIERVLLGAANRLTALGVRFTDGATSPQYLPRLVLEYKLAEGATKRELADAMRSAILDGRLTRGVVGHYPNRTPMHGLLVRP